MNKFDDIFSHKAKEAFDSYDAEHLAEEGWNAYVRNHGRRPGRKIFIPLWARAASVIVLVTAGVLFINRLNHRHGGEPDKNIARQSQSETADSLQIKEATAATAPVITDPAMASEPRVSPDSPEMQTAMGKRGVRPTEPNGPGLNETDKPGIIESPEIIPGSESIIAAAATAETLTNYGTAGADAIPAEVNLEINPAEIRLTNDLFAGLNLQPDKTLRDYIDLPRERMTTTIMTGFSGMMASIDNATSTAQGVSIGFYVERQLSRRISVRPGLAMAKHSYGMDGAPGSIISGGGLAMDYAAPELSGMSGTTTSFNADIDVVSMEVPVNFVFSVWKRAGAKLFLSTGASTVFYLSQHMSGNFNNTYVKTTTDSYGGVFYETMTTSVQVESDHELLNRVDFLGLANFSAGYSFPFSKGTHLLLEPFMQLPLKDLTSLNLRIRYGGLSMKIQF